MKNKIHYSSESRRDLDDIWDYIVSELQNRTAAEQVIGRIMDAVDQLQTFAEMGSPLSSIADMGTNYRFLVSGSQYRFLCHFCSSYFFMTATTGPSAYAVDPVVPYGFTSCRA